MKRSSKSMLLFWKINENEKLHMYKSTLFFLEACPPLLLSPCIAWKQWQKQEKINMSSAPPSVNRVEHFLLCNTRPPFYRNWVSAAIAVEHFLLCNTRPPFYRNRVSAAIAVVVHLQPPNQSIRLFLVLCQTKPERYTCSVCGFPFLLLVIVSVFCLRGCVIINKLAI